MQSMRESSTASCTVSLLLQKHKGDVRGAVEKALYLKQREPVTNLEAAKREKACTVTKLFQ